MKEEHRLLVAFLLSILIILIYGRYYQKKYPVKKVPAPIPHKKILEEKMAEECDIFNRKYSDNLFSFQNDYFVGKIDTHGGLIKEVGLKNYIRENEEYFYILENSLSLFDFCKDNPEWKETCLLYTSDAADE